MAFGEKLRKRREKQGISLDAISNTTKISLRMLRALEEEHFEQLPGGIFNKGFVRAYARQVGIDEEEAVADYLDALRESHVQQQAIMPDLRSAPDRISAVSEPLPHFGRQPAAQASKPVPTDQVNQALLNRRPTVSIAEEKPHMPATRKVVAEAEPAIEALPVSGNHHDGAQSSSADVGSASIPWMRLGLALGVVVVGVALWNVVRRHEAAASLHGRTGQEQSASIGLASKPPKPSASTSSPLPNNPAPQSPVASTKTAAALPPKTQSGSSSAADPSADAASKPASPTPASANGAAPSPKKNASAAQPATFTVLVRAEKTTWVSIVADGQLVAEETLIAPAHTSVRAENEVIVKAGNAAGVIFEVNGKQVGEPGADGEVKTYVFDASGIHATEQSAPNP